MYGYLLVTKDEFDIFFTSVEGLRFRLKSKNSLENTTKTYERVSIL
jgi:hypothetical protein